MIRVRQRMATEVEANLAPGVDTRPATVIGPQSVARATKSRCFTAKADGGPVILGNGGQIRSTRANTADPQRSAARHGHDETALLAPPSGDVRDCWITLIRMRARLGEPSFVFGHTHTLSWNRPAHPARP